MELEVIGRRDAVYWGWGTGGIEFVTLGNGEIVPNQVTPRVPGLMNNPQPVYHNFQAREPESPKKHMGWVEKSTTFPQTPAQKRKHCVWKLDYVFWFLRRFEGAKIVLSKQDVHDMRGAWYDFHELKDNEKNPLIISELALYDEGMNHIRTFNTLCPLRVGDEFEFNFISGAL